MSHKWRLWWRSVRKARLDVKSVPDGGGLLEGVHHGDPPDIPGPPLPALRLCPRRPGPADAAAEADTVNLNGEPEAEPAVGASAIDPRRP